MSDAEFFEAVQALNDDLSMWGPTTLRIIAQIKSLKWWTFGNIQSVVGWKPWVVTCAETNSSTGGLMVNALVHQTHKGGITIPGICESEFQTKHAAPTRRASH